MKEEKTWQVLEDFDEKKYTGTDQIAPRMMHVLSCMKKGDTISTRKMVDIQKKMKLTKIITSKTTCSISIRFARDLGILQEILPEGIPKTSFDDFCKIHEVDYWRKQLNTTNVKNIKLTKDMGTRGQYSYKVWRFDNWLSGKVYKLQQMVQVGENSFTNKESKVKFEGIIHMLKLFDEPNVNKKTLVKIIKEFLLDPMFENNGTSAVNGYESAIKSFFNEHDCELSFTFNSNATYSKNNKEEQDEPLLTLDQFYDILTIGKPSITERALFLCKFQSGADGITFADRLNFMIFDKLSEFFCSTDHNSWDLTKCPILLNPTRLKRGLKHFELLDVDAVKYVQKYLDYREKKTGTQMKKGMALFLNQHSKPINEGWIERHFIKLAENAGIFGVGAHELRDLLKSTLIHYGCSRDVADHILGHAPKDSDSYEKQEKMFPEMIRIGYVKASKYINIFSKFTSVVNGTDDTDELKLQLKNVLEKRLDDEAERIRSEKFAIEQQRQMKQLQDTVNDLLKKENMRARQDEKRQEQKPLEFCCIDCSTVHDKESCPACGSKLRRIYEDKVQN